MTNSQFLSRNTEPKLGPVKQPYFQLALALTDLGFLVLLNVTTWKLFFRVSAFLSISASHQQHQEQKQNLKDRISASHHLLAWDIFFVLAIDWLILMSIVHLVHLVHLVNLVHLVHQLR